MLQDELNHVLNRAKAEVGKGYTAKRLGREIEIFHGDFVEKFPELVPEQFKDIKNVYLVESEKGTRLDNYGKFIRRESPRMSEPSLYAIMIYLTDPNTKYRTLTLEAFEKEDPDLNLPTLMSEFLNPIEEEKFTLFPELLEGEFEGELGSGKQRKTIDLEILKDFKNCIFKIYLTERDIDDQELKFSGYAIWSNQEYLVFLLRNVDDHLPRFLISQAITTGFYNMDKISAFICTDIYYVENIDSSIQCLSELTKFSSGLAKDNADNQLKFMRKED